DDLLCLVAAFHGLVVADLVGLFHLLGDLLADDLLGLIAALHRLVVADLVSLFHLLWDPLADDLLRLIATLHWFVAANLEGALDLAWDAVIHGGVNLARHDLGPPGRVDASRAGIHATNRNHSTGTDGAHYVPRDRLIDRHHPLLGLVLRDHFCELVRADHFLGDVLIDRDHPLLSLVLPHHLRALV